MSITITRAAVRVRLSATIRDAGAVTEAVGQPALPADLANWLGRLLLLRGVPYPYLVPDERMLPLESIRFFRVDPNWTAALVDGAFSIGRNLSNGSPTASMVLDQALADAMRRQADTNAAGSRAAGLGVAAAPVAPAVTGFLLRSWVVGAYPGLGVNCYGGAQSNVPLPLLRMERLGTRTNVLFALIAGEPGRIDIHEAPEQLHFGIDRYHVDPTTKQVTAFKNVYPFTRGNPVSIDKKKSVKVDFAPLFRVDSPRTLRVTAAAAAAGAQNSAEMGFVMTEGVGLVSFTGDLS